jgi:hypothetical protein
MIFTLANRIRMTLRFPNQSRWYDASRQAIRFWGHDSAMETSFFVGVAALKHIQPDISLDEAGLLAAFDANRELIHTIAAKTYHRGHKGSYELIATDF